MKLHTLIIKNIGPYKGEHIIDFDELESSLFLITGETGAGKSYIFDAICYALYGDTSGEYRETNTLRCKYADDREIASIELTFETHGKTYKTIREPSQKRLSSKKNKDGNYYLVEYNGKSELILPDKTVLNKERDVKVKMEEILGLPFAQFKMTMLIAQGEFYKLINASTDERQKIFRKILETYRLEDFSNKLREEFKMKFKLADSQISFKIESLLASSFLTVIFLVVISL